MCRYIMESVVVNLTSQSTSDERTEQLVGEALLFGLLGKILYTIPSRDWLNPLLADNLFDSVPFAEAQPDTVEGLALLAAWTQSCADGITDAMLVDLKADHTALFVGLREMAAPAWESVYFSEERLLFQDRTVDVQRRYEQMGAEVQTPDREPADHIAFELSFVAHCAQMSLNALENGNSLQLDAITAAKREFLSEHLMQWGPKWAELVIKHAQSDFYRGLAYLVRGALAELKQIDAVSIPAKIKFLGIPE